MLLGVVVCWCVIAFAFVRWALGAGCPAAGRWALGAGRRGSRFALDRTTMYCACCERSELVLSEGLKRRSISYRDDEGAC